MELEKAPNRITQFKEYVDEVQTEMKRVTWPSWPQVRSQTLVVIVSVFLLSGYFAIVDATVNSVITKLINFFK